MIFVAAASNENNNNDLNPAYPASYDLANIISVMATTDTDQRSSFSNYGMTTVDIGAPGGDGSGGTGDILSTYPGGGYMYMAGTSMASPQVAGACALILSINPTLTYSDVKQILLSTVDPTLPGLCVSGGRLNLAAAAQEAATDTMPPTPNPSVWDIQPQATGLHTVTMRAQTATDRSGVEYYFECVNNVSINSGWEPNTVYSFTTLSPGTTYGFHFKARDKSAQHNQTDWSTTASTTTASGTDNLSPVPSTPIWAIMPQIITPLRTGQNPKVNMQAGTAYDESGVQYLFEETTGTGLNSGWQDSSSWTTTYAFVSNPPTTYTFQFQVRDKSAAHNTTTAWSNSASTRVQAGAQILKVPSVYPTIQGAIDAAVNGDIVEVSPYPVPPYYYQGINLNNMTGNINLRFKGKAITVRSVDPTNPAIVAATIIDCNGPHDANEPRRAFIFDHGEGASSVLAGFTIRNAYVKGHSGSDGDINDVNGTFGRTAAGGAILCGPNPDPCYVLELGNWGTGTGSPTISNCVFINCVVEGGDAGNGADGNNGLNYVPEANNAGVITPAVQATPGFNGGDGNTSGSGLGGAIYCSPGSNPVIQNCDIISCSALSGVPGNGGNGGAGGNDPNLVRPEAVMPVRAVTLTSSVPLEAASAPIEGAWAVILRLLAAILTIVMHM